MTPSELSGFRSKYGNLEKRAGANLLRKKLQPNGRKYFDSGDYNMKKESMKPSVRISIPGNLQSTDHNLHLTSNFPNSFNTEVTKVCFFFALVDRLYKLGSKTRSELPDHSVDAVKNL